MFSHYLEKILNYFSHIKPTLSEEAEKYTGSVFKKDLIAGLTVSALLIPNAIGYAILAGLSPVMGLYAALPAVAIAALWGSSRYIVTAPVGVVSLLAVTSLSQFAAPHTAEFITLAISLAVLVGLIQFSLGFFRLGIFARLIPHSAILGFTNAAALLIIFSQVQSIFVFPGEFSLATISNLHVLSATLGLATVFLVLAGKKLAPKFPISLVVIVGSIFLELIFKFDTLGVALVGYIPSGLPQFSLNAFSPEVFWVLLKQALLIALVGFVETYSIAKNLAKNKNEKINPDKELNGQGLANISSGLFGGLPVSGSFSSSVLNYNAGARSAVSGIIISLCILLALVFLGPFLALIPKPVLAGVVVAAITQLINFKEIKSLFNFSIQEGSVATATFIIALLIKPDDAIFVGIFLGLFFFIYRSMNLKITEVGIHKIHKSLWARENIPDEELELYPKNLILRVDYSIIFSNADVLEDMVQEKILNHEKEYGQKVSNLILNCGGVNYVDHSGIEALQNLKKNLEKRNIKLFFMLIKDVVLSEFKYGKLVGDKDYINGIEDLKKLLYNI